MATPPLDATERDQLCDLFLELGPDAPTLCQGWSTLDLAAHLVVRERDPRGGLVILGGERFAGLEEKLMGRAKGKGLDTLVARLRSGPPLFWKVPGARTALNLNEWFVHHEDVRRANGQGPRTGLDRLDAALWKSLGTMGRFMVRGIDGTGVTIEASGFGTTTVRKPKGDGDAARSVSIVGAPGELVLYLNGRREAARVELDGDEAALANARLGV